jgi:signal transduction histidine kinase
VRVHDGSHDLRLVRDGGTDWLVASDVTAVERAAASALELIRLRALANAAGGVVHDLNNLLNAALGLAAQLDPLVRDATDRRLLQELGGGTRQGAQLLRAIARLLSRPLRDRVPVPAATIVEEAMSLVAKSAATLGVLVHVEAPAQRVVARTVVAEAVQAVWHGAMSALEHAPKRLVVASDRVAVDLGSARTRASARVRLHAVGLAPAAAREIAAVVEGAPGLLASAARSPFAAGLAAASFAQRRLGGDLAARAGDDGVELEYRWPAAT